MTVDEQEYDDRLTLTSISGSRAELKDMVGLFDKLSGEAYERHADGEARSLRNASLILKEQLDKKTTYLDQVATEFKERHGTDWLS